MMYLSSHYLYSSPNVAPVKTGTSPEVNKATYVFPNSIVDFVLDLIRSLKKLFSPTKSMSERDVTSEMPKDKATEKTAIMGAKLAAVLQNPIYNIIQEVLTKSEIHFAPEIENLGLDVKSGNDIRNQVLKFISKKRLNSLVKRFGEKTVKVNLTLYRFQKIQEGVDVIKKEELESIESNCRDYNADISPVVRKRLNDFIRVMKGNYGEDAVDAANRSVASYDGKFDKLDEWRKTFEAACSLHVFFEKANAIHGEDIVTKVRETFPKFVLGTDEMNEWQKQFKIKCTTLINNGLEAERNKAKMELFKAIDDLQKVNGKTDIENGIIIKNLLDLINKSFNYGKTEDVLYKILMRSNFSIPRNLVSFSPKFLTGLFNNAFREINKSGSKREIKASGDFKNLLFKNAREVLEEEFAKEDKSIQIR